MEENYFPRPAVRRELTEHFVQAWLHSDHPEKKEANRALEKKMVGTLVNPFLVALDPKSRRELGRHEWPMDEAEIVRFLQSAWSARPN